MKKMYALFSLLLLIFFISTAEAKILRVGYSGPQVSGVDFTTTQDAITAAAAGDTIQLYQNASVGTAVVNKRLVFIGFGYGLENNPGLQAITSSSNPVSLYFNPGSENSVVQGIYTNDIRISVNNITIERCTGTIFLGFNQNGQNIPISNVTVVSSWVYIDANRGAVSNALISNSIVVNASLSNLAGLIANNILTSTANFGSCVVKNNIVTSVGACVSGTSAVFQNNLFARNDNCGITIAGSDNQFGVSMDNVFVNWNNGNFGSESNLALKTGSPGLGFGFDGNGSPTDSGIYGGDAAHVYKLSGIPAIPALYQVTAPQINANSNPYTITISVRSNN